MTNSKKERLLEEIQQMKAKLNDREAALPGHSVRPHQVQEIQDLEEEIAGLEKMLGEIKS